MEFPPTGRRRPSPEDTDDTFGHAMKDILEQQAASILRDWHHARGRLPAGRYLPTSGPDRFLEQIHEVVAATMIDAGFTIDLMDATDAVGHLLEKCLSVATDMLPLVTDHLAHDASEPRRRSIDPQIYVFPLLDHALSQHGRGEVTRRYTCLPGE